MTIYPKTAYEFADCVEELQELKYFDRGEFFGDVDFRLNPLSLHGENNLKDIQVEACRIVEFLHFQCDEDFIFNNEYVAFFGNDSINIHAFGDCFDDEFLRTL